MLTFRLEVTYAAGGEPQVHEGLDPERALNGLDAFVSDMVALGGQGVTKVTFAVEPTEAQRQNEEIANSDGLGWRE